MDQIFSYKKRPEDDYYTVLGCDELSSVEQITSEYKVRARKCHPDKHPNDPSAAMRFAQLQKAKETLTDELKRKDYDMWRACGMSLPYETWLARKDSIHTSMHWAMKTKKEPMIEDVRQDLGPSCGPTLTPGGSKVDRQQAGLVQNQGASCQWQRWTPNESLRRFRNYEI